MRQLPWARGSVKSNIRCGPILGRVHSSSCLNSPFNKGSMTIPTARKRQWRQQDTWHFKKKPRGACVCVRGQTSHSNPPMISLGCRHDFDALLAWIQRETKRTTHCGRSHSLSVRHTHFLIQVAKVKLSLQSLDQLNSCQHLGAAPAFVCFRSSTSRNATRLLRVRHILFPTIKFMGGL